MGACHPPRNKTNTPKQIEKDKAKLNNLNASNLKNSKNANSTRQTIDSSEYELNPEDSYFRRPMKNNYTNNELFSMNIEEIILGVHPTFYKKGEKCHKSFHPFFYLKLFNEDIENFGVIVQYLKVPKDVLEEQHHLYEKNGVEFIEKNYDEFENELKLIFDNVEGLNMLNISNYIITFSSSQFDKMTLGDFFLKAIPEREEWTQDKLKGFKKTCFDFCRNTIEKLNVKKKKKKAIEKTKNNLANMIDIAKDEKYYDKYKEGFEALFNNISE